MERKETGHVMRRVGGSTQPCNMRVVMQMCRCAGGAAAGPQTSKEGEPQQRSSPAKGKRSRAGTANVV